MNSGHPTLVFGCIVHVSKYTPIMSDNANLLDIMENDKMGRLGRYFVAKSAATR